MDTLTSLTKPEDLSTIGNPKGRPGQIGSLVGELGSGTLTSINERLKELGGKETKFQQPSKVTDRFYVALKAIYGTKFSSQFTTPAEVHQSKGMWGREIEGMSEDRLRRCLHHAKRELMSGNPQYLWPNIGLILGYNSSDWERQCHREFEPERLLEDHGAKEAAREAGAKAIAEMNALFGRGGA